MPTKKTPDTDKTPVTDALDSFDVKDWLAGATNPKTTVTVYRDGSTLEDLKKLTNYALQMKSPGVRDEALSIADEEQIAKLDSDTEAQIEKLREQLAQSGLTFHLTGFPQVEQQLLTKKTARKFKPTEATETEPGIPGGEQHPDFPKAISNAYLARSIEKVVAPSGAELTKKWTPEMVDDLRQLPGDEFNRLERAAISVVYMQYDVDTLVDQDFS